MILAESQRRKVEPRTPIPAINRFSGVYFRVLKKYLREGRLPDTDIFIVSYEFGILRDKSKVPYREPVENLRFDRNIVEAKRRENLRTLERIITENRYDEIYVNLGSEYLKLIEGVEGLTSAKITYSEGAGLGPKARHMKNWILDLKGR